MATIYEVYQNTLEPNPYDPYYGPSSSEVTLGRYDNLEAANDHVQYELERAQKDICIDKIRVDDRNGLKSFEYGDYEEVFNGFDSVVTIGVCAIEIKHEFIRP